MKKIILTASWCAVAVYCLLTGVYGPAGLKATALAKEASSAMHRNLDFLEKLNADLALEWQALRNDSDITAIQGRSLGFIAKDEVVVRVALPSVKAGPPFIGERVVYTPGQFMPIDQIRLATMYTWLLLLAIGLGRKLFQGRKREWNQGSRRSTVHREIRVQDASRT